MSKTTTNRGRCDWMKNAAAIAGDVGAGFAGSAARADGSVDARRLALAGQRSS